MSIQKLIDSLQKHIDLTSHEQEMLADFLVLKIIKKKQFVLHEAQIAKDVACVVSGCLRSYSIDQNGFEHILQFAPTGWWITDMYSFISQHPTHLNIDALMDTEVYLLSRQNQLQLFDKIPKLERYFRIVTIGMVLNILSNLILVYFFKAKGTVLTILFTEFFIMAGLSLELYQYMRSYKSLKPG